MDTIIGTPQTVQHSQRLIEFLASISERSIPARLLAQAQTCFIDSIGAGLSGAMQPWTRMLAENTLAESASGRCTLFGRRERIALAPSGLVNGTAIHGFELDDFISQANAHPGAVTVPAALAAAEHANASGMRLLLGIIAGYEVLVRLNVAMGPEPSQRGFHMTGVAGPIAAAVAAGVTMKMGTEELLGAIGLACSASSGIKSFARGDGGVVKRMHAGRSVEAGLRSCQLAQRGFLGPRGAIDGKFGLLEVFGRETARPERLTEALGERWAMDDVWVKVYPVCGLIQGTVQSLLKMRGAPLKPAEIRKIRVGVCRYATNNNANPAPVDTMGAQYSIPYCAALSAMGDPTDPASFGESAIARSDVRELATRVELFLDAEAEAVYPKQFASRVELELTSGEKRTDSVLDPHGSPANPCTDAECELKFTRLAGASKSTKVVTELLELMRSLGKMETVASLSDALRA
jgi:2-methylcitrate dehydratase PrpD